MLTKIWISLLLFFTACAAPITSAQQEQPYEDLQSKGQGLNFDDILVIIHFNHGNYESIPFLLEIYSKAFPNIIFYGEKEYPGVNVYPTTIGYFVYTAFADAMARWPDYKGYICVQDDCVMNFWNFSRLDQNKVWMAAPKYWRWINLKTTTPSDWYWWNQWYGRDATLKNIAKLPPCYSEQLKKNCGPNRMFGCVSDFFYVPGRLREKFIDVTNIFSEHSLFLEIGIPLILECIDSVANWELLDILWWDQGSILDHYDTRYDWVHPIKFSQMENRKFIGNIMAEKNNAL